MGTLPEDSRPFGELEARGGESVFKWRRKSAFLGWDLESPAWETALPSGTSCCWPRWP